ncbi:MFS transporter [Nocardioides terrisoli]|uniref:MFS transporter n=1 Tax=Nocardioides terrisoli TaxID=3388267 RepID=UPI00287B80DC|nr:MFS transporter [Nocardioides marmorisolisilvae]
MTSPRRPWLTRNLKIVSGVSLLQDAASELLYPLLPILLTSVLGAPAAVVGIVEGVAEGVAAVTKIVAGRLADRFPKVPIVASGYGLAAVGKVLVAAAGIWPVVLVGRCVDRLGKGIRGAPRDALLVDGIPVDARGRAFGFHRAADTAGAVIGPLIALGSYELLHHHLRPLLWVAVVPAVCSVLLVFLLHEPSRPAAPRPTAPRIDVKQAERLPAPYWRVVVVIALFGLVNFPDALVLLRLHEIGFSVVGVILAYVLYNVVYSALSYPAGVVADRLSPQTVVGVGLVVFAVVYAGLGASRNHLAAWLLLAGYGAYTGLTDGAGKAWVSSLLPRHAQGTGQGLFQGISGAAVLVAGVWAGLAWGADGRIPLLVSGCIAAVVAVALLALPRRLFSVPAVDAAAVPAAGS